MLQSPDAHGLTLSNFSNFSLLVSAIALIVGIFSFRRNVRLERARWATQLGREFFSPTYRDIREAVDSPDTSAILLLTETEPPEFTEFLNFFEMLAYLKNGKQIKDADVRAIFGYYLGAFRNHPKLISYIEDPLKSYGELATLLKEHGK
jgi:hypothetical protein